MEVTAARKLASITVPIEPQKATHVTTSVAFQVIPVWGQYQTAAVVTMEFVHKWGSALRTVLM